MIRQVQVRDIARLNRIEMSYAAPFGYRYSRRESAEGVTFHLERDTYDPPFDRTYEWDWRELDDFTAAVDRGLVWAAFTSDGEIPLGLLELRLAEWNASCWVQSLYIDRGRRRQGVGGQLINTALTQARTLDARALFVETQVSNGPAIRFYQKHGFAVCGVNDHFYSNDDVAHNEVALFMVRPLPPT